MSTRLVCCSHCRRCRPVLGVGPQVWPQGQGRPMLIGEGPGWEEDQRGKPFIGTSGRELRYRYLQMAGLVPEECFITNAIKCRQGKDNGDSPDWEDIEACASHHIPGELREQRPDYVVTLGANALRLFGGDRHLDMIHGRPFEGELYGWRGTVFPCYHPAAGLHQSDYLIWLEEDFHNLWLWRKGRLTWPVDEHPHPHYELIRDPIRLLEVLGQAAEFWELAIDTETDGLTVDRWGQTLGRMWCFTFAYRPGQAFMVLAEDVALCGLFRQWLATRPTLLVLYHNYLFDAPVLAQVDIVTPHFTDTMIEAYALGGLVPLGLKALGYRLCGMEMQDYEDLVGPYSLDQSVAYLQLVERTVLQDVIDALPWRPGARRCSGGKQYGGKHPSTAVEFLEPTEAICGECGKVLPPPKMTRDKGGRQFPWDRAGAILNTLDKKSTPMARWASFPAEDRAVVEAVVGPMPRASITQVPIAEAVVYACRDADCTLRVKPALRRLGAKQAQTVRRGA